VHIKRISDLKPGQKGVVIGVDDNQLALKLMEMGFLPGSEVEYNFSAPFGDPICVRISGYDLSMRLEEASHITIQ
jgi:ferrous iron transport protein A